MSGYTVLPKAQEAELATGAQQPAERAAPNHQCRRCTAAPLPVVAVLLAVAAAIGVLGPAGRGAGIVHDVESKQEVAAEPDSIDDTKTDKKASEKAVQEAASKDPLEKAAGEEATKASEKAASKTNSQTASKEPSEKADREEATKASEKAASKTNSQTASEEPSAKADAEEAAEVSEKAGDKKAAKTAGGKEAAEKTGGEVGTKTKAGEDVSAPPAAVDEKEETAQPEDTAVADEKGEESTDDAEKEEAKPDVRVCQELPSVRLDNGEGDVEGSGKEVSGPGACTSMCQKNKKCGQSIFSSGNKGCYLFEKPAPTMKHMPPPEGSTDIFTSSVCGAVEAIVQAALDAKRQRVAEVQDAWTKAEENAKKLLESLQPQDKFALLAGAKTESGFAGFVDPHQGGGNFEAPTLRMNDGPQGFNIYTDAGLAGTATQFPSLLTVAASFDPEVSRQYAAAIVEEFVAKGSNVLLGPDLEVTRVSSTGRSFESLSGEDPFLGATLVAPFIKEVQSKGIMATIKHWLDNNQEIGRMTMNVEVDDRTQHEIYMPPFQSAIDAGAAAVMCAYNKIYGTYACENEKLLTKLLREDAGFKGFVMSDWGATHDAAKSAQSGLDVEMPGGYDGEFAKLPQLVGDGTVDQGVVDKMATRVLTSMYVTGQFDGRFPGDAVDHVSGTDTTSDAHREVARNTITQGAVLLKNEDATLPLVTADKKIAFIGKYCHSAEYIPPDHVTSNAATPFMGQGSGYVQTSKTVTPFQEFQARVKDAASITSSDDAAAGDGADVAVVCVSDCDVHEGWDRMNYSLPEANELVAALRKQAGKKRIVMLGVTPGAVTTEWIGQTDATLMLFMPGEQVGAAVADMLTGAAAPSGRLPVTMPPDGWKPIGGYPAGKDHMFLSEQYPGTQPKPHEQYKWGDYLTANFSEGVLIGYRWFDAEKMKPAFPFGYGLSYTKFTFDNVAAVCAGPNVVITLTVKNDGDHDGSAVPQVYVSFPSLKPLLRQLKAFQKVPVPKGDEANVQLIIDERGLSYYDVARQAWTSAWQKAEKVTISVGESSRDLVWHKSLSCKTESELAS